jgi:putative peptidoglycan lipid II flippase
VATVLGQAPSLLVPLAVARVLGATAETDAFFLAFALVSFVLNALAGATQHALVPMLIMLDAIRARSLLAVVQTLSLLATITTVGLILLGAGSFANVSRWFVAALLPFALSAVLASVWTGALYAERRYILAALTPATRSLGVLTILWWFGRASNVYALVWGYSVGEVSRAWLLSRSLAPPRATWVIDEQAKRDLLMFLRTGGAQVAGSALIALIPVIDRFTASRLPHGSISLLDYAERVCQVPVGLLMSGFLVVSLAQWSHDAARGDSINLLRMKTRWNSTWVCAVSVIPIALFVVLRHPIARSLFGRAHLDAHELTVLGNTLGAYLLGVPLLLAGLIYARAFLVLGRTDWLLKVSVAQLAVKIVLNAVLTPLLGLPGIALSTAAVYGFGSIAHVWRLHTGARLGLENR